MASFVQSFCSHCQEDHLAEAVEYGGRTIYLCDVCRAIVATHGRLPRQKWVDSKMSTARNGRKPDLDQIDRMGARLRPK